MINHSDCDHPSTSSARAKCRREHQLPRPKKTRASTKTVDFGGDPEDNYGQTPGRREDECHICHVERIAFMGQDMWAGTRTVLVGPKCKWRLDPATLQAYST